MTSQLMSQACFSLIIRTQLSEQLTMCVRIRNLYLWICFDFCFSETIWPWFSPYSCSIFEQSPTFSCIYDLLAMMSLACYVFQILIRCSFWIHHTLQYIPQQCSYLFCYPSLRFFTYICLIVFLFWTIWISNAAATQSHLPYFQLLANSRSVYSLITASPINLRCYSSCVYSSFSAFLDCQSYTPLCSYASSRALILYFENA